MSASRERKKREDQKSFAQPETKNTKKAKKLSEGWIFAICMVVIVALVFGGMAIYRYTQSHKTVLTVGDHDVEVCEFNYFYRELAATFESYASYIGIDTTVGLDDQKIESGDTTYLGMFGLDISCMENMSPNADGVYNLTWAELFADNAMRNAASAYAVYQEAEKAGYELDADAKAEIDSVISEIKGYADSNNMSIDDYIAAVFGRGCDEAGYRQYMKVVKIASNYPSTIEYSAEEMAARDEQAPEEFDNVAFYYYTTSGSAVKAELDAAAEAETTEETDEETTEGEVVEGETEEITEEVSEQETEEATEGETEEATETEPTSEEVVEEEEELTAEELAALDQQAKEAAEKMAADFDINNEDVIIYADYTRELLESLLNEEAISWLFDSASKDEVKMFTIEPEVEETEEGEEAADEGENTYVVLKFITREDYNTANFLSITIEDDAETTEETEETTEETEPAAVRVEKIKAALEADGSEESFRALILENLGHDHEEGEEHDHENEGLSENQSRYSASTVSKEFFSWMFLEERTAGEWKCFDLEGKTVFYFYLGEGEGYRDMCIENTLLNEWYEELTQNAIANCGYSKKAAMAAEVGYYA